METPDTIFEPARSTTTSNAVLSHPTEPSTEVAPSTLSVNVCSRIAPFVSCAPPMSEMDGAGDSV